jgi:hypothetical protein
MPRRAAPSAPDEIGRICIAEELSIATEEKKTHIEVYLPEEKRNELALGDYVVIPLGYKDYKIFASVEQLCYRKRDALDDMSEVHVFVGADRLGEDDYIETAILNPDLDDRPGAPSPRSALHPQAQHDRPQSDGRGRSEDRARYSRLWDFFGACRGQRRADPDPPENSTSRTISSTTRRRPATP